MLDSKCNWVKSATNITNWINRIIAENFTLETWNIFLYSFANIEDTWTESDGWPVPDISWWYINAFCTLLGSSHCDTHLGGWTAPRPALDGVFNICLMVVFKMITDLQHYIMICVSQSQSISEIDLYIMDTSITSAMSVQQSSAALPKCHKSVHSKLR